MNTYIVRTHMSEEELSRTINQVDQDAFVDFLEDALILSQPINDSPQILLIHTPVDERMNMSVVPTHVLDWACIEDDICPACNADMTPQETYENGYCNKCGLSWTHERVWFECFTLEDDVATGQP